MINSHYFLLIGDGRHSAVLRTLPISGLLNKREFGFGYCLRSNPCYARISGARKTLGTMLCQKNNEGAS